MSADLKAQRLATLHLIQCSMELRNRHTAALTLMANLYAMDALPMDLRRDLHPLLQSAGLIGHANRVDWGALRNNYQPLNNWRESVDYLVTDAGHAHTLRALDGQEALV